MDLRLAIHLLLPSAQYGGGIEANTREEFDALRWEDERPKPTWDEVVAAHVKLVPIFNINQQLTDLDTVLSRLEEDTAAASNVQLKGDKALAQKRKQELRNERSRLEAL